MSNLPLPASLWVLTSESLETRNIAVIRICR